MKFENEISAIKPRMDMILTIGVFDGVHLGHRYLLNTLKDEAKSRGMLSGVITFRTHPETVTSGSYIAWLDDLDAKLEKIKELGIDIVVAVEFNEELKKLTPQEFVKLLQKHLRMKGLIIGPDFALGRNRAGDISQLSELGKELGFTVEAVKPFYLEGEEVKSSLVRQTIAAGDMRKVTRLLGRPFDIVGKVVKGEQRGRKLGFPTINIKVSPEMAAPPNGVYATRTRTGGKTYNSVTDVGTNPTFEGKKRLAETHILDFNGNLTGVKVSVDFIEKMRDEKKFSGAEELVEQIKKDVARAREILNAEKTP
jgi:riboflavin kinase / FMN adenylyltransferase